MRPGSGSVLDDPVVRQRGMEEYWRRLEREQAPRPPYSPRLRRDQIRALYYLKRFERRPMTKLLQEALDRYLEPYGGAKAVVDRGIESLATAARSSTDGARRPPRTERRRGHPAAPPSVESSPARTAADSAP